MQRANCIFSAILRRRLEHLRIMVSMVGPGANTLWLPRVLKFWGLVTGQLVSIPNPYVVQRPTVYHHRYERKIVTYWNFKNRKF